MCGVELVIAGLVPDEKCGNCGVMRRCFAQGLREVGKEHAQELRDALGKWKE